MTWRAGDFFVYSNGSSRAKRYRLCSLCYAMPDQHKSSKREHPVKQPAKRVHGVAHHQSVSHHSAATSRTPPLTQIAKAQYSLWRSSQRLLQRSEDEALKRRLDDRCHAAMAIAQRSACPSGRWQDAVAPLLVQRAAQQSLIFVDVGANKGYNVAQFLQRYSRPEANFMSHWSEAIRPHVSAELPPGAPSRSRHAGPHYSLVCGNCWSCFAGPPPKLNQYPPNVRVHAIDIVAKNVALMKTALTALRVPESAARLHHLAMSNESGSVTLADSGGLETSSIAAQGSSGASAGNSGVRVPAATLDEFASTHLQPQPQQKGGGDAASHAETVIAPTLT